MKKGLKLARPVVEALDPSEAARLSDLEGRIEAGLQTFLEVGAALLEIRDSRLYREEYATFSAYCHERWRIGRRHAYQLIDASIIVGNVRNCAHMAIGDASDAVIPLPANEAQVRPLRRLSPQQQAEAWILAVRTAPNGRLTAAHVQDVAQEVQLSRMQVHYTSASGEWYTPEHVLKAVVNALGGGIDLDPCSNCDMNPIVPATQHYTMSDDGLRQRWHGKVFMNPPYGGTVGHWTNKLLREYEAGTVTAGVALLPARTDTKWFRELSEFPRCFLHGRLNFSGHVHAAPFPSVAFYFGQDVERFAAAFSLLGDTFTRLAVPSSP